MSAPTEASLFLSAVDRMCPDGSVARVTVHEAPHGPGVLGGFVVVSTPHNQALVAIAQYHARGGVSLQVHSFVDGARVETEFGRNGLISIAAPRPETS